MDVRSAFEEAISERAESCAWIGVDALERTLDDLITTPAVGVSLPFEGISLRDLPVTTNPSSSELQAASTGITPAAFAIAEYGSVAISGGQGGCEAVSLYPDTHIAVVRESDVLPDMGTAIERLGGLIADGSTSVILTTGPSATADMGSLVHGAHGPRTVNVVVVEDR